MGEDKVTASLDCDILVHLFQLLDTASKGKAAQVCTSWKIAADFPAVWKNYQVRIKSEYLSIQSKRNIIRRAIKRFEVWVSEPTIIEFLRSVPSLKHIRFIGCCIKQNPKKFIDSLPNSYAILKLAAEENGQCRKIPGFLLENSQACWRYHVFSDSSCGQVNNRVLKKFTTEMKDLQTLHLDGCSNFSKDCFSHINVFTEEDAANVDKNSLQKLCLRHDWSVTETTIDYISQKFANLVTLDIEVCKIDSSTGFVHLHKLKKLESLRFYNTSGITDVRLKNISHISNLKFLDLGCCKEITNNGFQRISRLKNLMHLKTSNLTDASFNHLNELPFLQELGLRNSTISDEGLSSLSRGNLRLTKLDISFCRHVSSEGLLSICQSPFNLHILDVSGCYITDHGVSCMIEKFPYLQILAIESCFLVTDAGRQLIVEKLHRNRNLNAVENNLSSMILNPDRLNCVLESFLNNQGY